MDKPAYLESLELIIPACNELLSESSEAIMDDGISDFPIFVFHKGGINLGQDISEHAPETASEWYIAASTAEELIKTGIILPEKAKLFVAGYKNPKTHACILAVNEKGDSNFIFYPYR